MKTILVFAAFVSLLSPLAARAESGDAANPEAALLLVQQRISANDLDGATQVLDRAQRAWPAARGMHIARGAIAEKRGDLRTAFYEYQWELLRSGGNRPEGDAAARRSAALLHVESPEAVEAMGVMRAMAASGNAPADALEAVQAARKKGDQFVLRIFEAELRERLGGDATSLKLFQEAVKADPHFVPAHLGLSRALARAGKAAESDAAAKRAREIDPGHWSLQR